MIKNDVVKKFANKIGVSNKEAESQVNTLFEILRQTLESGEEIIIRKFGAFAFKERKPHSGYDFRKEEVIQVPAKVVVVFKPSQQMSIIRSIPKAGSA